MFNPFRPKPHRPSFGHPDCLCHDKPNISTKIIPVRLELTSFASFPKVDQTIVRADWLLTNPDSLSFILNKPLIASTIEEQGLATTLIVKQYVDSFSAVDELTIKKLLTEALLKLNGSTLNLGLNYTGVADSSLTLTKDSTITEAIKQILQVLKLLAPSLGGSNLVNQLVNLTNKVTVLLDLTVPTLIEGLVIEDLGGLIQLVEPIDLVGNKMYLISGGFSGKLPLTPLYGTIVLIVFSKGSEAMSVFTSGKDTIGYISLEYGAPVTKIYLGMTLTGLLLTSTDYKLIYEKSSLPLYSGNWIVL